jgi:hypothetical protein
MARITRVASRDLLVKNIEEYRDKVVSKYSTMFEGTPVYVTYYSRNRLASTEDVILDAVTQTVGAESPLRYDRVDGLALYDLQALQAAVESDQFGLSTDYSGDAVVIPDVIRPLVDDYFSMTFSGTTYLMRVKGVTPDTIHGKKFYRIEFFLSRESVPLIEEQVERDLVVSANTGGVDDKPLVVQRSGLLLAEYMKELADGLTSFYIDSFRNKLFGSIVSVRSEGKLIYDQMVVRFIQETNTLYVPGTVLSSVVVEDSLEWNLAAISQYIGTVFHAVRTRKPEVLSKDRYDGVFALSGDDLPFSGHWEPFHLPVYADDGDPIHADLLSVVQGVQAQSDDPMWGPIVDLIAGYISGVNTPSEALLDRIDSAFMLADATAFTLVPCAIYALRKCRETVLSTTK